MNEFDKNMEKIFDVTPTEIKEVKKSSTEVVSVRYNEPDMKHDLTDAYQQ